VKEATSNKPEGTGAHNEELVILVESLGRERISAFLIVGVGFFWSNPGMS
jgi:hypothetical protein